MKGVRRWSPPLKSLELDEGAGLTSRRIFRGVGNGITAHVPFNLITPGNLASFQPPVTTILPLTNNIVDDPAGAFWFDLHTVKACLPESRREDREARRSTDGQRERDGLTKRRKRAREEWERGAKGKIIYYWCFSKYALWTMKKCSSWGARRGKLTFVLGNWRNSFSDCEKIEKVEVLISWLVD